MTAWSSVELAVEAMRRGAADFIQKPWDNARLLTVLRTQLDLHRVQRQADMLEAENRFLRAEGLPTLIAESRAMQPVLEMIARIGPSDANVLITGEHGTGKEVVAQTLHMLSPRAPRSLVAVNTGALPEGTFESEIFGHVKGAFTDARTDRIGRFELADHGTLFLDEIANVPLRQQAKLLRVLETGELERVGSSKTRKVDVRLLSATNARPARRKAKRAASARTCSSASTPSRFTYRLCANAAKTFRSWLVISWPLEQAISPSALRLRSPRAGDDDAISHGPATCVNSTTASSVRC